MSGTPLGVSELVDAAMRASGILWVDTGERTYAVWHAWVDGTDEGGRGATAYVVNGPGEQHLPWLPHEVVLVLRSRDTGGRLLRVRARRDVLTDADPEWEVATDALASVAVGATPDLPRRWAQECTVTALRPFGEPLELPGRHTDERVTASVTSWLPVEATPRRPARG